ncbi:hypothetical protein, partial [Klebsiella quasipneumoniae]|uniref:hypothetical protein n=2 Tax=Klebsiella pneumoniae complex TaxID=3390273 RepID=UPI003BF75529
IWGVCLFLCFNSFFYFVNCHFAISDNSPFLRGLALPGKQAFFCFVNCHFAISDNSPFLRGLALPGKQAFFMFSLWHEVS